MDSFSCTIGHSVTAAAGWACNCIGPQNGQPLCPCQMRYVSVEDGRYVMRRDLGPAPKDAGAAPKDAA